MGVGWIQIPLEAQRILPAYRAKDDDIVWLPAKASRLRKRRLQQLTSALVLHGKQG